MKKWLKNNYLPLSILSLIIMLFSTFLIFLPSYYNPLTERGEAFGIFINGSHRGYGDYCGQYPVTWIRLTNASYNKKHWYGESTYCDFHFGNQWTDVDKMKYGIEYKIWYHKESRPSDTTSGNNIEYWVIDGFEKIN